MAENSKIEWCDHTFNPWMGCTKVSQGCKHCYAETLMDTRWGKVEWGPQGARVRTSESYWRQPLKWNREAEAEGRRYRVFCASLADVFEDRSELEPWRYDLFALIERTRNLDWLLLTKRPENVNRMAADYAGDCEWLRWSGAVPRPNIWIGTSVEDQETADKRIPELLRIPAAIRFLSCEPLLGAVDLTDHGVNAERLGIVGWDADAYENIEARGPDWVIVGGESGPKARPMDIQWAIDIKEQCEAASVPVFVKQLGARPVTKSGILLGHVSLRLNDPKGGDMSEWPPRLQIRQFPEPVEVPA
ncbi:MAG: DUF5131 family protein [Chloroflexota bacterium]